MLVLNNILNATFKDYFHLLRKILHISSVRFKLGIERGSESIFIVGFEKQFDDRNGGRP
jgi:hypothetical protein